jgi:hypothetical protein
MNSQAPFRLTAKYYFTGPFIPRDEFTIPLELATIPRDMPLIYFAMGSSGTPDIVASSSRALKASRTG